MKTCEPFLLDCTYLFLLLSTLLFQNFFSPLHKIIWAGIRCKKKKKKRPWFYLCEIQISDLMWSWTELFYPSLSAFFLFLSFLFALRINMGRSSFLHPPPLRCQTKMSETLGFQVGNARPFLAVCSHFFTLDESKKERRFCGGTSLGIQFERSWVFQSWTPTWTDCTEV